jgi:diguanylate cyclase (GGDEF)-like protein
MSTAVDDRLGEIERLRALDHVADPVLQSLARVAAHVTGAASAAIHVIDDDTQHRIAASGVDLEPTPRGETYCRLVVESGEPVITGDASDDDRFTYTPHSQGPDAIRSYVGVPLRAREGEVIGTICIWDQRPDVGAEGEAMLGEIATQVASHLELTALVDELGAAAAEDPLTGAANRLILTDRLNLHLARLRRHPVRIVVAAIDLDGFKAVNDTYGHAAGDEVLRQTAARLANSGREEDTVARIGGDEFIVVAEVEQSRPTLDSLRQRFQSVISQPVDYQGQMLQPAATVGVVAALEGEHANEVLERADRAMYARKPGNRR